MTISPEVFKAADLVLQNSKASNEILIAAECLHRLISEMSEKGKQHAKEGHYPSSKTPIEKLLTSLEPEDFRDKCSTLLYDAYITGYKSVH